jgi:hypothetical protein
MVNANTLKKIIGDRKEMKVKVKDYRTYLVFTEDPKDETYYYMTDVTAMTKRAVEEEIEFYFRNKPTLD